MSKTPWILRVEQFVEGLERRIIKLGVSHDQELLRKLNDSWDLLQDNPALYGEQAKREIEEIAKEVVKWEEKNGITLTKKDRKNRSFGFSDFWKRGSDNDSIGGTTEQKTEPNGNVYQVPEGNWVDSKDTPSLNKLDPEGFLISVASGKNEIESNFEVYIEHNVYQELMAYTKLLDDEITGLLTVERNGYKFTITGIEMFRQIVSKTQCEQEDDLAIIEMYQRMIKENKDPSKLKCWWHSHNNMGVSPSGTDYDTIKKYGVDFAIMMITNHSKDVSCQIHIFKPFEIKIKNVPVYVIEPGITQEIIDKCQENIKTFVKSSRRTWKRGGENYSPLSETRKLLDSLPSGGYGYPGYDYYQDGLGGY